MPTYISLIRGINVGGHKSVKMDQLRTSAEGLGFQRVRTYVQSGNLVFESAKQSPSTLSKKIEGVILKEFGHAAAVITKTSNEISEAIQNNPFLKQKAIDITKLHLVFLSAHPQSADVKKLDAISSGDDQYRWREDVIYLYLPNGAGESKLANAAFEKLLSVRATTRNWRTVNNLQQMAMERG